MSGRHEWDPEQMPLVGGDVHELAEAFARATGLATSSRPESGEGTLEGGEAISNGPTEAGLTGPALPNAGPAGGGQAEVAPADGAPTDAASDGQAGDALGAAATPLAPSVGQGVNTPQPSPLSILEALLFVGNQTSEPLRAAEAAQVIQGIDASQIPELVEQLNQRYLARGAPYHIVSQGAGYRMVLRDQFGPIRNRLLGRIREARLSQAAIDVLAIVAYRQPVTADEVSRLRGHPSSHLLAQLVRRRLLQLERGGDRARAAKYRTTERFLELFGLDRVEDLPRIDEGGAP